MHYLKHGGVPPAGCATALSKITAEAGGYYEYNYYDDCIYEDDLRRRRLSVRAIGAVVETRGMDERLRGTDERPRGTDERPRGTDERLRGTDERPRGAVNDYVCGGGPASNVWVNASAVRAALHVPYNAHFFTGDDGRCALHDYYEMMIRPPFHRVMGARE